MPTFDASSQSLEATNTNTVTWDHVLGAGSDRILVVGYSGEDLSSATDLIVTGITFDGVPMTPSPSPGPGVTIGTSIRNRSEIWYMLEADLPAAGTYAIVVTITGTVSALWGSAVSLTDAGQSAPEAVAVNTATVTGISTDITTLTDLAVLVDVVAFGNHTATNLIPGETGQTQRAELQGTNIDAAVSTREIATAAEVAMSWTGGGAPRAVHTIVAIAPAAGEPEPGEGGLLLLGVG